MACPPTCGIAAEIVCPPAFAPRNGNSQLVEIVAQAMPTDLPNEHTSAMDGVGQDMGRRAARSVYEASGIGPNEVQVVELHDCFTTNEFVTYKGIGLCGEGEAEKFVDDGDNTYGGRVTVNPSGGLMSKGHSIGATGLAQCFELLTQVRGRADKRQVPDVQIALQHNLGVGGAAVVTMYRAA